MLVGLAATRLPDLKGLADAAIILTPYATLFRYPDAVLEPDDNDMREALTFAGQVVDEIQQRLAVADGYRNP